MEYSTRIFGTETETKRSFRVKDIADFNHLCERFFLDHVRIKVPHGHPLKPLEGEQLNILVAHVVITDGANSYDYLIKDTFNLNQYDLGVFHITPEHCLHLSPEDTFTVDVPSKADFFFAINYFIRPL